MPSQRKDRPADFVDLIPPLLTTRRAVWFSGQSRHAIGRAVRSGALPVAGRRGRTQIFRRVDLEAWLLGVTPNREDDRGLTPIRPLTRAPAPLSDALARIRATAGRKDR